MRGLELSYGKALSTIGNSESMQHPKQIGFRHLMWYIQRACQKGGISMQIAAALQPSVGPIDGKSHLGTWIL